MSAAMVDLLPAVLAAMILILFPDTATVTNLLSGMESRVGSELLFAAGSKNSPPDAAPVLDLLLEMEAHLGYGLSFAAGSKTPPDAATVLDLLSEMGAQLGFELPFAAGSKSPESPHGSAGLGSLMHLDGWCLGLENY